MLISGNQFNSATVHKMIQNYAHEIPRLLEELRDRKITLKCWHFRCHFATEQSNKEEVWKHLGTNHQEIEVITRNIRYILFAFWQKAQNEPAPSLIYPHISEKQKLQVESILLDSMPVFKESPENETTVRDSGVDQRADENTSLEDQQAAIISS